MSNISVPVTVKPYADGQDASGMTLEEAFPTVNPEFKPYGSKILVQLRRVRAKSKGGIILTTESTDSEAWNMQVGMLIAAGPLAFKNRKTGEPWPEGTWAALGDFVRFPRWNGDRLTIRQPEDGLEPIVILILDDHHLLGQYTGDPLQVRSFIE